MNSASTSKLRKTAASKLSALPTYLRDLIEAGGAVYEVGGPVRDRFLGRAHKDHDILVCKLPLDQIRQILARHGDVYAVGRAFGILKFYPHGADDLEYDVAMPRTERSTGTGHRDFEVDFDPHLPVEEDLIRRDFTINAMAVDYATGQLIDPFKGQEDLQDRTLRQVQDNAFVEDPLRLLRGVQFASRLHFKIEEKTWTAMQKNAELITTVSAERISEEINKLLTSRKPSVGFCIMRDTGLLQHIFPELHKTVGVEQGRKLKNDDVFMHTMRVLDASRYDEAIPNAGDLELMLAALFHDVGKPPTKRFDKTEGRLTFYGHQTVSRRMAEKRMKALKMTTLGINPKNVANLVENHMFQAKSFFSDKAIRRFIRHVGEDLILKLVDLRIADNRGGKYPEGIRGIQNLRKKIEAELASRPPLTVGDLAISGHDLMEVGIAEGPEIGQVMRNLLEVCLDDPTRNTRENLLHLVKDTLGYGG